MGDGSKVSKSITGEAYLFSKDLYKNKQCSVTMVHFHGRVCRSNQTIRHG